jgi:hypothetical protein
VRLPSGATLTGREYRDVDALITLPPGASQEDGARFAAEWRRLAPGRTALVRTGGHDYVVSRHHRRCWHGPDDVL